MGGRVGYVEGHCRATNLCEYCRILGVIETAEMLMLDALEYAPTLWLVLTAREHLERRDTYAHLQQLRRACKKRWPSIEWAINVEFQKRGALHLNLLVKGVSLGQAREFYETATRLWCSRVDAKAGPFERQQRGGQTLTVLHDANGVVKYLQKELVHGLKSEQAPPIGWRGHRTSQSRGYLVRPASVMREEARASIALKRLIWAVRDTAAREGLDLNSWDVEQIVCLRQDFDAQKVWDVYRTAPGRAETLAGCHVDEWGELHREPRRG